MGSISAEDYYSSQAGGLTFGVKTEEPFHEDPLQLGSSEEDIGDGIRESGPHHHLNSLLYHSTDQLDPELGHSSSASAASKTPAKDAPISKRTLQNRKAQREFRQRRATYLKDLEAKVRRYEGDPSTIHPEVHHRMNHLVQENQYLRAIIDRLQQENIELRKLDPAYSHSHQHVQTGPSQHQYTLHQQPSPHPQTSPIQRTGQSHSYNSLAVGDMYQGGYDFGQDPIPTDGEYRPQSTYPTEQAHMRYVPDAGHGNQFQQSMDWSAVRQSAQETRPPTATLEVASSAGGLPYSEHEGSDSAPAYIYHTHHPQQQQQQPPPLHQQQQHVQSDGLQHYQSHIRGRPSAQASGPSNSTPQSITHSISPASNSSSGQLYGQFGPPAPVTGSFSSQRPVPPHALAIPEQNTGWNAAADMPYSPATSSIPTQAPTRDDAREYQYQPPHAGPPPGRQYAEPSRSNTHSPALKHA